MSKFLNNINLESGNDIQFKTTAGVNAGKIEQDGNNLVLSNAVGDVLLGDGSSDVYIGDGTNNVDILFEQSGSIKGDGSAVTLTIGGANTTLNLENPNINGTLSLGATSINNKLTFTTANGYILFDHEPSGDTGAYEGTTSVPLLKIDRSGSEKTILERISQEGGILLGADDSVIIAAGDTRNTLRSNLNEADEKVVFASEAGFHAYGFPSNDTTWSNRNEFRFRSDSATASDNGLYIGDGTNVQFIDLNRNLKNIGTIGSGTITSTGNVSATSFIKSGGTTNQFLKANGNVDGTAYAPLASPALTGNPTAPTQAANNNSTRIATTAYVKGQNYLTSYTETDTLSTVTARGRVTSANGSSVWDTTTQGTSQGSLHLMSIGSDHAGGAITFDASDSNGAQAGIYVKSDGSYGTKMYLSTTDSYASGSKSAISINHQGYVNIVRGNDRLTVNGNTVWHAGNDGSGTGLDADLLDGNHASAFATAAQGSSAETAYGWGDHSGAGYLTSSSTQSKYLRSDADDTTTGKITFAKASSGSLAARTGFSDFLGYNPSYGSYIGGGVGNASRYLYAGGYINDGNGVKTLWHSGNDGTGTGLDADLLDAQEGSYYRNATNLNAGTVAAARLSTASTQPPNDNSTKIATTAYVQTELTDLIGAAPAALDTLSELADAINDDSAFSSTVTTSLGNRLRVDTASQGLNSTQKSNARTNLGLGTAATSASTAFATAAQGTSAENALPKAGGTMTGALNTGANAFGGTYLSINSGGVTQWGASRGILTWDTNWASIYATSGKELRLGAGGGSDNSIILDGSTVEINKDITTTGTVTATGGNSTNWNTAYTDRNKWDGGSTGLTASTGRTSLGLGSAATQNTSAFATASHNHDDRYYTETETNGFLNLKANLNGATFTGDVTVGGILKDGEYHNAGSASWKTKKYVRSVGVTGADIGGVWVYLARVVLDSAYEKARIKFNINSYDDVASGVEAIDVSYENHSTGQEHHILNWYTTDNNATTFSEVRSIRSSSSGLSNTYDLYVQMSGDWRDTFTVVAESWVSNGSSTPITFPTSAGSSTAPTAGSDDKAATSREWYTSNSQMYSGSNKFWHAGNDGPNSGLDADTVDGVHASSFLRSDASDSYAGDLSVNGMTFRDDSNLPKNFRIQPTATSTDVGLSMYLGNGTHSIQLYGTSSQYGFLDGNWANWDIKKTRNGAFEVDEGSGLQRVFNAGYHPNADTLTTARTIALSGAVTGSASFNGGSNITIATTNTADPTLTLAGDATGAATFTNLGNATLTVAVANDSHTHDGRYYTETETSGFLNLKANLASPALTGNPTAPTQAANNNSTRIATTAYVQTEIGDYSTSANSYRTTSQVDGAVSSAGWVTVATNTSGRKHGEVIVSDSDSGDHAFIRIDWMRSYADSNFSVLQVGGHSNQITGVRVLYQTSDNTYGTKLLQVYVATGSTYGVRVHTLGSPRGYAAHGTVTPVIENTKSGYAVHGNTLEGLDQVTLAAEEGIKAGGLVYASGGNSSQWNTAYGWGNHASAGYVTSSGNTIIGTDSDIDTSGATVIDQLNMTDGVIQSHSTRTLTLANLGYTGATNANNYSLPEATATARGGIELFSNTDQSVAANSVSATSGRTYGIQLNSAGQAVVNVPWSDTNTDTNTTYSAGNGISLSSTTFSVAAGGGLTQTSTGLSHSDTSSQASVNNSSGTVIQDITLDTYGHITAISSANLDGRYYTETETNSFLNLKANLNGATFTGNLTVSKTSPLIRIYDSNAGSGSYPALEFDTANNQGVAIEFNEFDGELPAGGYGLIIKESSTNTQFPTTGTLSLSVLGEIYAGSTSIGSVNRVFHDGYHPNADTLTTARTINGVSFNGSSNITVADSTKLPLSGGTVTGNVTFNSNINVGERVTHNGDSNTWMGMTTDQINFYAGNVKMLTLQEGTHDQIVINENGGDVNFRIESDLESNAFYIDGAGNGSVGILTTTPTATLDVDGTIEHKVYTVSTLPSASPAGKRAFVSDAYYDLASSHGSTFPGGGSYTIPCYSDGSNWRAG